MFYVQVPGMEPSAEKVLKRAFLFRAFTRKDPEQSGNPGGCWHNEPSKAQTENSGLKDGDVLPDWRSTDRLERGQLCICWCELPARELSLPLRTRFKALLLKAVISPGNKWEKFFGHNSLTLISMCLRPFPRGRWPNQLGFSKMVQMPPSPAVINLDK